MKTRSWLMALCAIVLAPIILAGCNGRGDNHIYVGWVEVATESQQVSMALDSHSTYQLQYTVMPVEATDKRVAFSSSDPSVASVDEDGMVTAISVGTTKITITPLDNNRAVAGTVDITVTANKEKLATPTGLTYDAAKKKIVWNEVNTTSSFKPSYRLNLNIDGVDTQVVTASPSYDVTEFNQRYTVSVIAMGNSTMYEASDVSSTISFVQLGKPEALNLISSGNVDTGDRAYYLQLKMLNYTDSISDYTVDVRNIVGGVLSEQERLLWNEAFSPENVAIEGGIATIKIPSELVSTTFSIRLCGNENLADGVYGSEYSDAIKISKLSAPTNLNVTRTDTSLQLTWSTVPNASKYKILIEYLMNTNDTLTKTVIIDTASTTPTIFDFANLENKPEEGTYRSFDIYMYAIGADTVVSGVHYLDSSISDLPAKQQLNSVQSISIQKDTENKQYIVRWNEVENAATYKVYICPSDALTVSQEITENDRLFYYGNELSCAIAFNQEYTDQFGQSSLLWEVGKNYLKIVACPPADSKYTESNPKLHEDSFIKLDKPGNLRVSNGELVWDAVDGANGYTIDFANGSSVLPTVENVEGLKSYSYEPTQTDMPETSSTYYVTVNAVNSDVSMCIDSEWTSAIDISRYATPTNLRVGDGQLLWSMTDALGNPINTNTVEVKITNRNGDEVVPVFTTQGAVGIENVLQNVTTDDKYFVIQVRAINAEESGSRYVNGDWTKAISTYQLPTPTNVRLVDGLITWDAFSDPNIDPMHKGIRYLLQVGSQEYGVKADPILDINSTSAIIKGLTPNAITYGIKLKVVIDATKSAEFGTTIIGSDDVYIINSNFSTTFNVKQLSSPSDVLVQDSTLYWGASSQSLNKYRVELYRLIVSSTGVRTRESTPILSEIVSPQDPLNPKYDFSLMLGTSGESTLYNFSAGAYQFVVYAVGTTYSAESSGNYGYLTSYNSNYVEIYKLDTPILDVEDGYVKWQAVYSELTGAQQRVTQYMLYVSRNTQDNVTVTETITVNDQLSTNFNDAYKLPEEFSGPQLTIRIQAVSSWAKVFNSEISAPYKKPSNALPESKDYVVFKQTKVQTDTSHVRVDGTKLIWTDTQAENKQFSVKFYSMENSSYPIRDSAILNDYEYELPDVEGGKYFVTIMRRGYVNEDRYARYLDSEYSDKILLEKFDKPVGLAMQRDAETNNPTLYWSATNVNDYMRFKININHIYNGQLTTYTYYMPNTARSLDLYGYAFNEADEKTKIETFGPGTLRITIQAVKARQSTSTGEKVLLSYYEDADGNIIYLIDSTESAGYNAYIYSAPTIDIQDGVIYLNKSMNQFDKGAQMIFTPVVYDDETLTYSVDNESAIQINIASGIDTFDMKSQLQAGVKYYVKLRALGNSNNIIESVWEDSQYVIQRLLPLNANTVNAPIEEASTYNGWYVKDGTICWQAVEGVQQYIGQITDSKGEERNAFTIDASASVNSYSSGVSNVDYGTYKLQFKLVGGATDSTIELDGIGTFKLGYVTSEMSNVQEVIKLYAPNDYMAVDGRSESYMRISNGEFDWGIRDETTNAWIDCEGVTAYRVEINQSNTLDIPTNFVATSSSDDVTYNMGTDQTAQYFDAKASGLLEVGQNNVRIYSIGNDWTGTNDTGRIYLSSDTFGEFTLINAGQIDDFCIRDGKLQWSAVDNGSTAGYDITYQAEGDIQRIQSISYQNNTYSFDDLDVKGCKLNNIMVRHAGDKSTVKGAYSGHINTVWSAEMDNIVKLPNIEKSSTTSGTKRDLYINEWGQLAWTYGSQYIDGAYSDANLKMHLYLDITYLGVKVGGYSDGWDIDKPTQYFDVPTITITPEQIEQAVPGAGNTQGILKYIISGYVMGTQDEIQAIMTGSQVYYLNSDTYSQDAYKIGDPTSFTLDEINGPGLRLNWDISNCSVSGYEPEIDDIKTVNGDMVLFTYFKNASSELQHKLVYSDEIDQIPLWEVAFYDEIRLTVLSSEGDAFASSTLYLNNISFRYFASGSGTRENPFVIKTSSDSTYTAEQQLGLIYWLPEMYFELGEDIKLTDLSTIRATTNAYATMNFPVPADINSTSVNDVYKKIQLTGGINGKGFTISNFQTSEATSFGWWNSILGGTADGATIDNDVFLNKKGIIRNLNILAYEIDLTNLASGTFNGVYAKENYGYIIDCTLDGASLDDRHDAEGNYIPVVKGKVNTSNVSFGGFAGIVGKQLVVDDAEMAGEYIGEGTIQSCVNMLDISVETLNELGYETYAGGIAGVNYSGKIIDCTNGSANMVQANNRASILGYYSGGIVGGIDGAVISQGSSMVYDYPYVVGCKNYGTVTSNLRETNDQVKSAGGGIVGLIKRGFITYSINFGTVTTQGIGAALGGIVGSQDQGSYTLCCINTGLIKYNTYYNLATLTKTNIAAGGLIGLGAGGSLFNSWTISHSVQEYNQSNSSINTYDFAYGSADGMNVQNISTTTAFTSMSQDEINQLLSDEVKSVNQVTVLINADDIQCIYERYDGLFPIFTCTLGQNPNIEWVVRELPNT